MKQRSKNHHQLRWWDYGMELRIVPRRPSMKDPPTPLLGFGEQVTAQRLRLLSALCYIGTTNVMKQESQIEYLIERLTPKLDGQRIEEVSRAYEVAADAHSSQ